MILQFSSMKEKSADSNTIAKNSAKLACIASVKAELTISVKLQIIVVNTMQRVVQ